MVAVLTVLSGEIALYYFINFARMQTLYLCSRVPWSAVSIDFGCSLSSCTLFFIAHLPPGGKRRALLVKAISFSLSWPLIFSQQKLWVRKHAIRSDRLTNQARHETTLHISLFSAFSVRWLDCWETVTSLTQLKWSIAGRKRRFLDSALKIACPSLGVSALAVSDQTQLY